MIAPMLCKVRERLPARGPYLYEVKLDGQRTLAEVSRNSLVLYTRSLQKVTPRYPELQVLCESLKTKSVLLDGEIVALKDGIPSFELLQLRMALRDLRKLSHIAEQVPVVYYVFDVLEIDGKSLLKTPLGRRKQILHEAVKTGAVIKILPFFESMDVVKKALEYGYEGVVAKKKDSPYLPGQRSDLWIKHKFVHEDIFVICGWMEGKRSRAFGSLIIGVYQGKELVHVGRAGTGFTEKTIEELLTLFKKYESTKSPLKADHRFPEAVHWLKPRLQARIKFTEWTNAGILRNPVYLNLATNKVALPAKHI